MITNSFINKLKASKSSRDLEDIREGEGYIKPSLFEKGEGEKDKLTNSSGDSASLRSPLPTIVICQREKSDNRFKSRPRVRDEFRMARGGPMDRRGSSVRSRGCGISRKVEREGESNLLSRGKFQESLNKGNSDSLVSSSKYYSDVERSKNRLGMLFNLRTGYLLSLIKNSDSYDIQHRQFCYRVWVCGSRRLQDF